MYGNFNFSHILIPANGLPILYDNEHYTTPLLFLKHELNCSMKFEAANNYHDTFRYKSYFNIYFNNCSIELSDHQTNGNCIITFTYISSINLP